MVHNKNIRYHRFTESASPKADLQNKNKQQKRPLLKARREGRFPLQICLGCHQRGEKRESSPRCGAETKKEQQLSLPPARNTTFRSRDRKMKSCRRGKGRKRRAAGRILSRKKAEGGARRDRQRWRGNQRGMGELAGSRQGLL